MRDETGVALSLVVCRPCLGLPFDALPCNRFVRVAPPLGPSPAKHQASLRAIVGMPYAARRTVARTNLGPALISDRLLHELEMHNPGDVPDAT